MVKNPPANVGDVRDAGLIPGSGRSPGVGNGNPLQYFCLEKSVERSLAACSPWSGKESDTINYPMGTNFIAGRTYTCLSEFGSSY